MSNYKISRRYFISAAGTMFVLPMLESLMPFSKAWAAVTNDPKRYVGFYCPDGSLNNNVPTPVWGMNAGAISASNTCPVLNVFPNLYSKTVGLMNLNNDAAYGAMLSQLASDDHVGACASYFTATTNVGTRTSFEHVLAGRFGKEAIVIRNESINAADQVNQRFCSFQNGVGIAGYSGPDQLASYLLGKVVPSNPTPSPTPTSVPSSNKSIIDSSVADFNALKSTLGRNDKLKMDEYLAALRELELKVAAPTVVAPPSTPVVSACQRYTLPTALANSSLSDANRWLPDMMAYNDMIRIAFACDITRSASIMLGTETSDRALPSAPSAIRYQGMDCADRRSHSISHAAAGIDLNSGGAIDQASKDLNYQYLVTRDRLYMHVVNDLATKLGSALDPSGSSIMDNTIIQIGHGVIHGGHSAGSTSNYIPFLIGGPNVLGGGKVLQFNGSKLMKDMYYSISAKLGAGLTSFEGSTTLIGI